MRQISQTQDEQANLRAHGRKSGVIRVLLSGTLYLSVIFLASVIGCFAQPYTSVVSGRVLDDYGKPIANAAVWLESLSDEKVDTFTYRSGAFTNSNGEFSVENISNHSERKRRLFVLGSAPTNAISLIELPPTSKLSTILPHLVHTTVSITGEKPVHLGDIKAKTLLRVVEITLVDSDGKPFLVTSKDGQSVFYVLRDGNGTVYVANGISTLESRSSIDVTKSIIRLAVPAGVWNIAIISDLDDLDSTIAATGAISVKIENGPIRLRLTAFEKNRPNQ